MTHHQPPPHHHRQHTEPPPPPPHLSNSQLNHQPLPPPPPSQNHHYHTESPPNRHRNYYQHYHPHTSTSSAASIRGCCCCLILLFSFLFLLTLTVVLVIVLAVKPKKPQFELQQVAVEYINLAAPVATTASLSLAIRLLFTAKNDNTVGIKYGTSTFNIMYRGIPLGRGSVPGFFQPAHSVRQVQTTVTVDRVNLMQTDAADLVKDALVNDRVELRILGDISAEIRILGLTSPSVQASVDCGIAISPTKQALVSKQCGFDGLQV
ncbi:putative Late embryogenesis abundant protein, LEA_2 subgroup [Helianthus debilis subsp. tardiflorus]